jgi:dihydroxyacetone kinase-like predicted kinase
VVAGEGNRRLFEQLGASRVVAGGQTMNPSTADLLEAVDAVEAEEVVLLPNNANVVLAADQASRVAGKPVRVVPTTSIPAGLAALVAFHAERSAEENAHAMEAALAEVATGEIAVATRGASTAGVPVREGEYLALLEGDAVAAGAAFDDVVRALLERLLAEPRDVLTLLTGEGAPPLNGLLDELAERYPELEIDVQQGGQPHYPLLISAE